MPPVMDSDTHLYESRTLWSDYADPRDRAKTLRIADDDLGHAWLMFGDRRIGLAEVHHPGDVDKMGAYRSKGRAGEKAEANYDDPLPRAFSDPAARVADLDRFGIDETVVFPNFGLLWERPIEDDLEATKINMAAWNRWTVDMAAEGKGRLHPVAHLSLRDLDWLDQQLAALAAGGIRLAMIAPALVDGRPLSHPDLDRAWAAFIEHDVAPVFHVANQQRPFDEAWYASDPEPTNPVLSSVFLWVPAALAISDLVVNGVLERRPELRLGVIELSAVW